MCPPLLDEAGLQRLFKIGQFICNQVIRPDCRLI